jgi:hypothetical protein
MAQSWLKEIWEGCVRKQLWHIFRQNLGIYLEGLKLNIKILILVPVFSWLESMCNFDFRDRLHWALIVIQRFGKHCSYLVQGEFVEAGHFRKPYTKQSLALPVFPKVTHSAFISVYMQSSDFFPVKSWMAFIFYVPYLKTEWFECSANISTILFLLITHIILLAEELFHSQHVHWVCSIKNDELLKLHYYNVSIFKLFFSFIISFHYFFLSWECVMFEVLQKYWCKIWLHISFFLWTYQYFVLVSVGAAWGTISTRI